MIGHLLDDPPTTALGTLLSLLVMGIVLYALHRIGKRARSNLRAILRDLGDHLNGRRRR